jgi:hypothetical protein
MQLSAVTLSKFLILAAFVQNHGRVHHQADVSICDDAHQFPVSDNRKMPVPFCFHHANDVTQGGGWIDTIGDNGHHIIYCQHTTSL